MKGRWPVTLAAAFGALLAGGAAQVGGSPLASLGWALAAGVGLSLMLRGFGLRIVGVLLSVLAVVGAGWAIHEGQWVASGGFVLVVVAALGILVWGPNWRQSHSGREAAREDPWKAMDRGLDPTAEQVPSVDED